MFDPGTLCCLTMLLFLIFDSYRKANPAAH